MAGVAAIAGCTSTGGTNNPFVRNVQYFSYLNGDDIRKECQAGNPSRYRLIYNALYEQQVRTYDIRQADGAKTGVQDTRVFRRGIGGELAVSTKGADFGSFPHSTETLQYEDLLAIDKALIDSGFEQPAQKGLILHSDDFYWIAMVCRKGAFKYFAWSRETADLEKLPLIEALSRGDRTDAAVAPVRDPIIHDRGSRDQAGRLGSSGYFSVEVGDNGLKL